MYALYNSDIDKPIYVADDFSMKNLAINMILSDKNRLMPSFIQIPRQLGDNLLSVSLYLDQQTNDPVYLGLWPLKCSKKMLGQYAEFIIANYVSDQIGELCFNYMCSEPAERFNRMQIVDKGELSYEICQFYMKFRHRYLDNVFIRWEKS